MEGDNNREEIYRECLRNHAASLGSYATDGCGEFTFDGTTSSLHCAACGCHRNFHRKLVSSPTPGYSTRGGGGRDLEYMAMAAGAVESPSSGSGGSGSKKRYRTKFTAEQKEKMLEFAEKLGWKLIRKDLEDEIDKFCRSVGVTRQVFKVWMHNHKNNAAANSSMSAANSTGNASSLTTQ